jgi:hypothetical protein
LAASAIVDLNQVFLLIDEWKGPQGFRAAARVFCFCFSLGHCFLYARKYASRCKHPMKLLQLVASAVTDLDQVSLLLDD